MKRSEMKPFDHSGSSFESCLEEEGIREEAEAVAIKRVLAWELSQEMKRQRKTKQTMARELRTSRSQLDRLMDPQNVSVSLETMARAARALGRALIVRIGPRKGPGELGRKAKRSKPVPAKHGHQPEATAKR